MKPAMQETIPQIALRNRSKVGRRKVKVNICDFDEEGIHTIKHLSLPKISASHEELMSL